jgi:hypothetical protein
MMGETLGIKVGRCRLGSSFRPRVMAQSQRSGNSVAYGVCSECKEAWLKLKHLVWCSFIEWAFGWMEHQAKTRSQTFFTLSTHLGTLSFPYFVIEADTAERRFSRNCRTLH